LAQELAIEPQITFVGNVSDVRGYLGAADIFVLPSEAEGISNALLEAMAAGLACIATSVGGSPEVLDNGSCGVLLPPQRPDLFADALASLAHDPHEAMRLGVCARDRILEDYSF